MQRYIKSSYTRTLQELKSIPCLSLTDWSRKNRDSRWQELLDSDNKDGYIDTLIQFARKLEDIVGVASSNLSYDTADALVILDDDVVGDYDEQIRICQDIDKVAASFGGKASRFLIPADKGRYSKPDRDDYMYFKYVL